MTGRFDTSIHYAINKQVLFIAADLEPISNQTFKF